jgi:hypothetical protein
MYKISYDMAGNAWAVPVQNQNYAPVPQPPPAANPYEQRSRPRAQSVGAQSAPLNPGNPSPPYRSRRPNNRMEQTVRYAVPSPAMSAWEPLPDVRDIKKDVVNDLLKQLVTVRVGVEVAAGRGSVSASIAALKELIHQAKDWTEFQVIYEHGAQEGLKAVLGAGFNPSAARQSLTVDGRQIKFIKAGHLDASDQPARVGKTIGFVGANDAPDHPASRWSRILGNRQAGEVAAVGVAQPYGWAYGGPQSIVTTSKVRYLPELNGKAKGFRIRVPAWQPLDIANVLGQSNLTEHRVLASVFEELGRGNIDMMPIYGLHHPSMKKGAHQEDDFVRNIYGGIQAAHRNGLPKKAVVLVVVGDYAGGEIRGFDRRSNTHYDPHTVRYADDASTPARMRKLRPGQMMLLYAGKVQQDYFQQLFRLSTLPPCVEGANAANLCQNLPGKPYLHMDMGGTVFPEVSSDDLTIRSGRDFATKVSKALERNSAGARSIHRDIGDFIFSSMVPESNVRQYFARVNKEVTDNNQVVDILYHIAEEIGVGPEQGKSASTLKQRETSAVSNVSYELWTDGSLYQRKNRNGPPLVFSMSDLKARQAGQHNFGLDHREQPGDLFFTGIAFTARSRFDRLLLKPARAYNLVLHATGAVTQNKYVFQYDESTATVMLTNKNGRDVTPALEYTRRDGGDADPGPRYKAGPSRIRRGTISGEG